MSRAVLLRAPVRVELLGTPGERGEPEAREHPRSGRPYVREALTAASLAWRKDVSVAVERALGRQGPFRGAVGVTFAFTVRRPESEPGASRVYPHTTGRLDRLGDSLIVGLKGVAWVQPTQLVEVRTVKRYVCPFGPAPDGDLLHEPGVVIRLVHLA